MLKFIDFKKAIQLQFDMNERTEYACQCCKQFIRTCGGLVSVINNKLVSLWDIEIGGHFQIAADKLSKLVKSKEIKNIFLHDKSF